MALTKTVAEIVAQDTSGLLSAHPSWRRVHLREVAQVLNGFPFDSAGFNTERGTPLARIRDVLEGRTSTFFEGPFDDAYLLADGDLLVGMDGDFNCARWRGGPALLNQRVCKVTVDSSQYEPRLLDALLPVYLAAINAETSSVTVKHLSSRTIEDIWLPLPPRAEQARLADALDELLGSLGSAVADLGAAKRKLTLYRQSLLKSAVAGSLTAEWREHNPPEESGSQLLKRISDCSSAPDLAAKGLPASWAAPAVRSIGDVQLGRQRAPKYHAGDNMLPYLRVANVFEERIDTGDVMTMHFSAEDEARFLLEPGDILLNEGQSPELVGRPAMFNGELDRVCFTNTLVRFRASPGVEGPYALLVFLYWLHSGAFRALAPITTNIAHLGASRFAAMSFPLPPTCEQQEIVRRFADFRSAINEQSAAIERALSMAAAQRQNILRAAFSGQLVPQDPTDEPASVLLERIRAQRPARAAEATGRRPRSAKERA